MNYTLLPETDIATPQFSNSHCIKITYFGGGGGSGCLNGMWFAWGCFLDLMGRVSVFVPPFLEAVDFDLAKKGKHKTIFLKLVCTKNNLDDIGFLTYLFGRTFNSSLSSLRKLLQK